MIELVCNESGTDARILVVGVGGGGNNAVNRMIDAGLKGVTFAAVNTDSVVLENSKADHVVKIGEKLLNGYGAGANPDKGEAAAVESEDTLKDLVHGYNMVILTSGMGGGTGTGATPVIAKICQSEGILTMAVVTKPFSFESRPRMATAEAGIARLREYVDTLLVIPNDKLFGISDRQMKLKDAFVMADSVLRYTIEGITNIVFKMGEINTDFNDLRTTLEKKGTGHIGIGTVSADGAILDAVNQAVNSPLLETSITGAQNLLINTSGEITLMALNEAVSHIKEIAGEDVNIIWGTVAPGEEDADKIVVTIIATGMPEPKPKKVQPKEKPITRPANISTANISYVSPSERVANIELKELVIPSFLEEMGRMAKARS